MQHIASKSKTLESARGRFAVFDKWLFWRTRSSQSGKEKDDEKRDGTSYVGAGKHVI